MIYQRDIGTFCYPLWPPMLRSPCSYGDLTSFFPFLSRSSTFPSVLLSLLLLFIFLLHLLFLLRDFLADARFVNV